MNKSSKKLVVIKKDIIFAEQKENVSTCPMCYLLYSAIGKMQKSSFKICRI